MPVRSYATRQGAVFVHIKIVTWLVEKIGMEQCKANPCVFRKTIKNGVSLMVGVHVDNTIVFGEQSSLIS